jgi:hypothetical protein
MYRQMIGIIARRNKVVDFPVRIAGNILQSGMAVGFVWVYVFGVIDDFRLTILI